MTDTRHASLEGESPPEWGARLGAVGMFSALWWIISLGEPSSLIFGVPAIAVASYAWVDGAGMKLRRIRAWPLIRLSFWFLIQSIQGGVDVACRVMGRRIRVSPAVVVHEWRLPHGGLRTLVLVMVNLQPGTLGTYTDAERLYVHVLDDAVALESVLTRLEMQAAALLGLELSHVAK